MFWIGFGVAEGVGEKLKNLGKTTSLENMLASLRAAGEETRLRLLVLLSRGEQSVKDMTAVLEQSQPRISRHLKLLSKSGLVERYQEGSWVYYRLADSKDSEQGFGAGTVRAILGQLDDESGILAQDKLRASQVRLERKEMAQHYFQKNAAQWHKIRSLHVAEEQVEQAMLEMMGCNAAGEKKYGVLVDLGTGTGRMLELFAPHFHQGIGFDLNKDMLSYARDNLANAGLSHCQLRQGELCDIALDDGAADAVIIHQVLHFLDAPSGAVQEAVRILKPGGRILVADFARHDLDFLREKQAHRRLGIGDEKMREWMTGAGLEVQEHKKLQPDDGQNGDKLTVSLWQGQKTK